MNAETVCKESPLNTTRPAQDLSEEPLTVLPADVIPEEAEIAVNEDSALGLVELLLKNPERVERLNRDAARLPTLVPRFLAIALASYTLFAVAMMLIFQLAP